MNNSAGLVGGADRQPLVRALTGDEEISDHGPRRAVERQDWSAESRALQRRGARSVTHDLYVTASRQRECAGDRVIAVGQVDDAAWLSAAHRRVYRRLDTSAVKRGRL